MTRKKGLFTHFGSWIYLAIGIIFVAYVFGYISHEIPTRIFGAISAQRNHVLAVSAIVVPAGFLLGLLFVLYLFFRMARNVGRAVSMQSVNMAAPVIKAQPAQQPKASVTTIQPPAAKPKAPRTETLPRPANPHHAAEPVSRAERKPISGTQEHLD
ncbi:MAG: hypothetical protein ACYC46_12125 [Acidobacteriaceae bacterium]